MDIIKRIPSKLMNLPHLSQSNAQIYRIDPLVGCANLLGFIEWINKQNGLPWTNPWSLFALDINSFKRVNDNYGHTLGDAILRWLGLFLIEETGGTVYRLGGDEFAVVLQGESHPKHVDRALNVFERLNAETERLKMETPIASMVVIHYPGGESLMAAEILTHLDAGILETKLDHDCGFYALKASDLKYLHLTQGASNIIRRMTDQLTTLGEVLDQTHDKAYTDPLTGIPNSRAIEAALPLALAEARSNNEPLSIMLIDGDNLGDYNSQGYSEGDKMICRLAGTLVDNLRPKDFLARWRSGDEFLVILPDTSPEAAVGAANRLCKEVKQNSASWIFPITISIGVAGFDHSGEAAEELINRAESANFRAKSLGKNRVEVG